MTSKRIEELALSWIRHSDGHGISDGLPDAFQKIDGCPVDPRQPPISFRSSPYLIRVKDAIVYATSALTALNLPFVVEADVWIETICPTDGTSIALHVTRDGVETCSPADCVLSVVIPHEGEDDSAASFSQTIRSAGQLNRFFSSRAAAMTWLVAYPEVMVLPIKDAWRFAALIHGNGSYEFR